MSQLSGNLLVAQSGGPTAVINASVAGVIQEAGRHPDHIEEIYGGLNGIWGILREDLIDLQEESSRAIEGLKFTPGAALGTCRYKLDFKKKPEQAQKDMDRLFEVFQAHNIRYFFYAGGNDSQDTAHKIHEQAVARGYEMRVVGVPKTIDNDLPYTDHCPGYGSTVKYAAATVMEIAADVGSMATEEGSCCIIEVMGRHAGWIAAGTILAKRSAHEAPHIILTPEIIFDEARFLARVKETVEAHRSCVVVAGEGLRNEKGEEVAADKTRLDAFGHPVLSGVGEFLEELLGNKLRLKARSVKLGYAQRAAGHFASQTDANEAVACGEAAVKAAVGGQSGVMVKLVRQGNHPYKFATDVQPLGDIANVEHKVPREWISEDGFLPNEKFVEYVRPLIHGEVKVPIEDGLPKYITLARSPVEKKLAPRA
ncbi:MAG: Pyrophosphate--fructose 6-phosphate 1-phosphotransferase [Verrucomicrobiota bacterium]|jgi:6-phosphofructokinase 1